MSRHRSTINPYATSLTRTGKLDTTNRKPYRTAAQQADARATAVKVDGTYVSGAAVSYHRAPMKKAAA
ncbi:hypothetical protein [Endobacterium cereale]|uniref:hypothetical protein n=1 Tax=Endobacterium cereale TaxID=2663029 RepID=UPI002B47BB7C|nr:hypothetical protein [Endobacterium cereale]MEB2845890.1 hypothetical protein [Endobacterium cereale]